MNALITLLVTLTSLGSQPAATVEPEVMQKCVKGTETILRRIQAMTQANPSFELRDSSEERALCLLEAFNANPSATLHKADQVMTLVDARDDGNKNALVMLITTGCMIEIIQTSRENWREVLSTAIGSDT